MTDVEEALNLLGVTKVEPMGPPGSSNQIASADGNSHELKLKNEAADPQKKEETLKVVEQQDQEEQQDKGAP